MHELAIGVQFYTMVMSSLVNQITTLFITCLLLPFSGCHSAVFPGVGERSPSMSEHNNFQYDIIVIIIMMIITIRITTLAFLPFS